MKPPFAYFGGKTTLADRIVAVLPDHHHYIEPFAGSLAVLLAKPPSHLETVNDLDGDLMTFWRVLRDQPDALEAAAALTPHGRAEFYAARELDVADDIEKARRVWVLLSQSRSGTLRRTGWRYHSDAQGTNIGMPRYLEAYGRRMPPAALRLIGVSLESRPALEVVRDYGGHASNCLYVDPPYFGATRKGRGYQVEMPAEDDHRALAAALAGCSAAVVLSGYDHPLYDELYDGWARVEIATDTRQGGTQQARLDVLWCNRPIDRGQLELVHTEAAT